MKEYESIATQAVNLPNIANDKVKDDWRVICVLPDRYLPENAANGRKLADIVIIFERDAL
jgi:hypothetical protein